MDLPQARQFLETVWGPQEEGYHFLARKDFKTGEWKDICKDKIDKLRSGYDYYFCPYVFREPRRLAEHALSTVWLHADLDEVDPFSIEELPPTYAWETSPNRYQCLWRLSEPVSPKQHRALNQRLNYLVGADKGGWSITKVLRIPGTTSYKRKEPFEVRQVLEDMQHYSRKTVVSVVRHVDVEQLSVDIKGVKLPDMTAEAVYSKHKAAIPKRAKELLRARKASVGERSDRLWELERLLADTEVPPEEILILVRDSVWNKYAGTRRELPQLWKEVQKAVALKTKSLKLPEREFKLTSYSKFLTTKIPNEVWTVEAIWSHQAHGLIAGEPKTYKSILATDLAVSVASGTQFLGHFDVPKTGPVIIIQEENTPGMMRDRIEKIATSRHLMGHASMNGSRELHYKPPADLPISLMNNAGFNLTDEDHLDWLEQQIQQLQPTLIVLDPLYLMMPGIDENSAVGLTPVLRNLLTLKQTYDVGILLIHHYNKPRSDEDRSPGNRISGSSVFYRWFESALYLEKGKSHGEVWMTPEHRGQAPTGRIHLEFDLGEMGEPVYHVDVEIRKAENNALRKELRDLVNAEPGITVTDAMEKLEVSRDRVVRTAERLGFRIHRGQKDGKPGRPAKRIYPAHRKS